MGQSFGKILVVDDHDTARLLITLTLRDLGYSDIFEATSGESAASSLEEATQQGRPFGLVFSDVHMPGIDGLELLRRCTSQPEKFGGARFVMVTAEVELHCITEALKLGAVDYIRKPINVSNLRKKIEAITKKLEPKAA